MTETRQDFDKQPSIYDLIDHYGIAVRSRPCSCCGERLLYEITYAHGEKFIVCARCDVEHAKKT